MLFQPGQIVATPNALGVLNAASMTPMELLHRHLSGDWGDLDAEDKKLNDDAIKHGSRIFSAYKLDNGEKVWVITEADRSSTCVLLPEDY
jgi:hypothetical protein